MRKKSKASRRAHEYLDELAGLAPPELVLSFVRRAVKAQKSMSARRPKSDQSGYVWTPLEQILDAFLKEGPQVLLSPQYAAALDFSFEFWKVGGFDLATRRKIKEIVVEALALPPGRPSSDVNTLTEAQVKWYKAQHPYKSLKEIRAMLAPGKSETLRKREYRARKQRSS